ncbi:hypothetical protein QBC39DRAFT_92500 [Podospora conica]|nr:hypothetical protein QBC39DRAFT_92500 [Schizothecium conicum]
MRINQVPRTIADMLLTCSTASSQNSTRPLYAGDQRDDNAAPSTDFPRRLELDNHRHAPQPSTLHWPGDAEAIAVPPVPTSSGKKNLVFGRGHARNGRGYPSTSKLHCLGGRGWWEEEPWSRRSCQHHHIEFLGGSTTVRGPVPTVCRLRACSRLSETTFIRRRQLDPSASRTPRTFMPGGHGLEATEYADTPECPFAHPSSSEGSREQALDPRPPPRTSLAS